jgi:pilus assembly protein CpaE
MTSSGSDSNGSGSGLNLPIDGVRGMSIAVVDADFERGNAVSAIVCSMRPNGATPRVTRLADVGNPQVLANQGIDVVLMAVDRDKERSLEAIEALCSSGKTTLMAYSGDTGDDMLIQCMRAGVREFLHYPFEQGVIQEAFRRKASRGQLMPDTKKAKGKSFVFFGAKGGSGVTTAACNFAVSLAQESKRSTLLIDLDLPLGDAALCLGVGSEFSTLDALNKAQDLDSTFLAKLLSQHQSGLRVLAAPGKYHRVPPPGESVDRLLAAVCESFDYVVVDAGSKLELMDTQLFDLVSTIYLVTQVGIAELRNANRVITECFQAYGSKVEVVLNRYTADLFGINDEAIESALTVPAQWRIPNDFAAVRRMQHTTGPLEDSKIQRAIGKMAAAASGLREETPDRKKKAGFLRLLRA